VAADAPPETTTVRVAKGPAICIAPQYVAEDLLRAEGFTDVRYIEAPPGDNVMLSRDEIDFGLSYAANVVLDLDRGMPLVAVAGVTIGCFELFGNDRVQSITELRGKASVCRPSAH